MLMILLLLLSAFGIVGSIWLSRLYPAIRGILFLAGGLSLWLLLIANYAVLIENPVPIEIGFLILPIPSFAIMGVVIMKLTTSVNKKKQKRGAK